AAASGRPRRSPGTWRGCASRGIRCRRTEAFARPPPDRSRTEDLALEPPGAQLRDDLVVVVPGEEDSGVRRPLVREQALLVDDRNVDAGQVLADPKRVHLRHVLEQLRPEPAVVAHRRGLGRRAEADYLLRSAD